MEIIKKEVWTADPHFLIERVGIYELGVLLSNVHNAWMRTVAGRLKSDYRYSKYIFYNTFSWAKSSDRQQKIKETANKILEARELYPDSSYADLYKELTEE